MDNKKVAPTESVSLIQKQITDDVLSKINDYRSGGLIKMPKDYSVENALKAAGIILQETKDKDGKVALQVCTRESVALALLKMVVEGLSPLKKHGSFIVYGSNLTWQREYDGDVALAKRAGLEWIRSRCIFEKDIYETFIDEFGVKKLQKHEQPMENIDLNKIKGAYAIYKINGEIELIEMTITQIRKSWEMGYGKGNTKAHNNFTDEMCRKTVERRACKPIIRRSDDSALFDDDDDAIDPAVRASTQTIEEHANQEEIGFDDAEEVKESPEVKEKTSNEKIEAQMEEDSHVLAKNPGF